MIDVTMLFVDITTLVLYIIALTLSIRRNGQKGVLSSMKQIFLFSLCISTVFLWYALGDISPGNKLLLACIHIVIVGALCFSYILGLLGLPLTSLRTALLLTLAHYGDKGASIRTLLKIYSKHSIMHHRLHRLETSGEIVRRGNYVMLRSRTSYFVLHNRFLLFLIHLYFPFGLRPVRK